MAHGTGHHFHISSFRIRMAAWEASAPCKCHECREKAENRAKLEIEAMDWAIDQMTRARHGPSTDFSGIRKARKEHECFWCKTNIVIGEPYFHTKAILFGELYESRIHLACKDAHKREGQDCGLPHEKGKTCLEMKRCTTKSS